MCVAVRLDKDVLFLQFPKAILQFICLLTDNLDFLKIKKKKKKLKQTSTEKSNIAVEQLQSNSSELFFKTR